MEQIIRQIVTFLTNGIETILKFLQIVWTWSFGQIVDIFQSNWQALPIWKMVVLAIVLGAIAYYLYSSARQIWGAAEGVFKAFVGLLSAFVAVLPYIVISGLIAFAGGYVIQNVNF
ncbi:unnamed protein product [Scytosiphon promiscuus]